MDPQTIGTYTAIGALAIAIIGQLRGWWESPRRKEERAKVEQDRKLNQAIATALLGRAEVTDNAGGILVPKELGLVAKVDMLDRTVTTLVDRDSRIKALEAAYVSLTTRVDAKDAEQDAAIAAIIAHTFDTGAQANLEAERLKARGTIEGEVG